MNNLDSVIVILFGITSIVSLVILIIVALILRRIDRNIEHFLGEFRKDTNIKNASLDRNFADIAKEIKRVSYRLDSICQELRDIVEESHGKDSSSKGQ